MSDHEWYLKNIVCSRNHHSNMRQRNCLPTVCWSVSVYPNLSHPFLNSRLSSSSYNSLTSDLVLRSHSTSSSQFEGLVLMYYCQGELGISPLKGSTAGSTQKQAGHVRFVLTLSSFLDCLLRVITLWLLI